MTDKDKEAKEEKKSEIFKDQRIATWEHIYEIQKLILRVIEEFHKRIISHDQSKLGPDEAPDFQKYTHLLKDTTYDSDEYHAILEKMKPAIKHHYANNRHHPEHFGEAGINGMNLIDVLEMIVDWKASTKRQKDGNLYDSLKKNKKRFGIDSQLEQILKNTIDFFEHTEG